MDTESTLLFALGLTVAGAPALWFGIQCYRGLWRPWNVFMAYLGPALAWMGGGLLVVAAAVWIAWGAAVAGSVPAPDGTAWQWASTGLGALGAVGVVAGVVFAYWWMPAGLRPSWIRQIEGLEPVRAADGTPARLPAWTLASSAGPGRETGAPGGPGTTPGPHLRASAGPVLDQHQVDLLWRNFAARAPARAVADGSVGPLLEAGLIGRDGRATPEGLLLTQPRRTPSCVLHVLETVPGPAGQAVTARELRADVGPPGHACVFWQEERWPADQSQAEDARPVAARLGLSGGPGRKRLENTPYRVDAVAAAGLPAAVASFAQAGAQAGVGAEAMVEGTRWRLVTDAGVEVLWQYRDGALRGPDGLALDPGELEARIAAVVPPVPPGVSRR
ncbi:hypothetical protein ACQ3I4_12840 [Zafaria sp. Z1313]|uniref:hypothetical protein n=1 Tax=unclassified Zafaria TaxID=2828765 RepID=UPI002E782519|nr:hypothetical protein [Zafaria sp. J156]MEE1622372.1 hypothetical protein [Zafaria sp. J156]